MSWLPRLLEGPFSRTRWGGARRLDQGLVLGGWGCGPGLCPAATPRGSQALSPRPEPASAFQDAGFARLRGLTPLQLWQQSLPLRLHTLADPERGTSWCPSGRI